MRKRTIKKWLYVSFILKTVVLSVYLLWLWYFQRKELCKMVCTNVEHFQSWATEAFSSGSGSGTDTTPSIETTDQKLAERYFLHDAPTSSRIPNIIWMYWNGPMNPAVELCVDSWRHYHPDYQVHVLNRENYRDHVDTDVSALRFAKIDEQRFSDFLRCALLVKHGGIWVDASIICHSPVTWVHAVQTRHDVEMVGYYHKWTDPSLIQVSPILENWFIACVPGSPFMRDWCDEFMRVNEFETIHGYLANLKDQGIQFVNMQWLDYLTMHASAQKVFQTPDHKDKYKLYLFCASCGPFRYMDDVEWDTKAGIDQLLDPSTCKDFYEYVMVKLCKNQRIEMNNRDIGDIRRAFLHLV